MSRISHRALPLGLSLFLLIAQVSKAQQSRQEEVIRLKANLVQVDVVVTDKDDRLVRNIRKEDFVLLEDGASQEISFFSFVEMGMKSDLNQSDSSDISKKPEQSSAFQSEQGRFIFIIIDRVSQANRPQLRESLLRFITEDLDPQDQVAIISTSGSIAVFQQVTKNRRILSLVIDALFGKSGDPRASNPSSIEGNTINVGSLNAGSLHVEYKLRSTLDVLASIAKNVSHIPGRKIAILFSEYLPVWLSNKPLSLEGSSFENLSYELQQVIGQARRGGLVFYTIDPRGLTVPIKTAAEVQGESMLGVSRNKEEPFEKMESEMVSRDGMRQLAAATGGLFLFTHNDLRVGLQKVIADNQAYYVLEYYSTNPTSDGKFRRIKVSIRNRSDLKVRTRQGYLAPNDKDDKNKADSKQASISKALASMIPLRNIKVAIPQISVVKDSKTGERVASMALQVDAGSLSFKEEGQRHLASIEVIGFVYDINNRLVDGFSNTINMRLRDDVYKRVLREGIPIKSQIRFAKPGLYSIRIVAINLESGDMGTASEWLEAQ